MARTVAIALVALLAFSMAAEISAQGKFFCRTSAYKGVSPTTVRDNKLAMFKTCGADVAIVGEVKVVDGCTVIVQKVANEAAWKKYSDCEKSSANSARYGPLKAGSDACKALQKSGPC